MEQPPSTPSRKEELLRRQAELTKNIQDAKKALDGESVTGRLGKFFSGTTKGVKEGLGKLKDRLPWNKKEEEDVKTEIKDMSPERRETMSVGFNNIGFITEKKKNDFFAKVFDTAAKKVGNESALRFCLELRDSFQRDADKAQQKAEEAASGKNKRRIGNALTLTGNVLKYGRIIGDLARISVTSPLRYAMMSAMAAARTLEAAKETRFKNEEVIDKTRIKDADQAAEEAWNIYENAQLNSQQESVSAETLRNAYLTEMPADIIRRLEKPGTANNFVQNLVRKDLLASMNFIDSGLLKIESNEKFSPIQKEAAKQKLLLKWERRLKDYDRMVSQYGTVDGLALAGMAAQTGAKAAVITMQIETLFAGIAGMLTHESVPHNTEGAAAKKTLADTIAKKIDTAQAHDTATHTDSIPSSGVPAQNMEGDTLSHNARVGGFGANADTTSHIPKGGAGIKISADTSHPTGNRTAGFGQDTAHKIVTESTAKSGGRMAGFGQADTGKVSIPKAPPGLKIEPADTAHVNPSDRMSGFNKTAIDSTHADTTQAATDSRTSGFNQSPDTTAGVAGKAAAKTAEKVAGATETATKTAEAAASTVEKGSKSVETIAGHEWNHPMEFKVKGPLEHAYEKLVLDHTLPGKLPDTGVVLDQEQATRALNEAANLVRLTEGHNTAGIRVAEFKEAFSYENGTLKVVDGSKAAALIDKLHAHSAELVGKGVFKDPESATGYIKNVNWLEKVHGDGMHDTAAGPGTGIIGHPEVTQAQIGDFSHIPTPLDHAHGMIKPLDMEKLAALRQSISDALEHNPNLYPASKLPEVDLTHYGENTHEVIAAKAAGESKADSLVNNLPQAPAENAPYVVTSTQQYDEYIARNPEKFGTGGRAYQNPLNPRADMIMNLNPAENPFGLTDGMLAEVSNVARTNLEHLIPKDTHDVWNHIRNNSAYDLWKHSGPTEEGQPALIKYMDDLVRHSGLKPKTGILGFRKESIEDFTERALQKAAQLGNLDKLRR